MDLVGRHAHHFQGRGGEAGASFWDLILEGEEEVIDSFIETGRVKRLAVELCRQAITYDILAACRDFGSKAGALHAIEMPSGVAMCLASFHVSLIDGQIEMPAIHLAWCDAFIESECFLDSCRNAGIARIGFWDSDLATR
ncbi:MAG: hypothetical protein CL472_07535 [Acidobacteria bacterium]|nr:hypothetical protein [Acidobacteriota bacterium]